MPKLHSSKNMAPYAAKTALVVARPQAWKCLAQDKTAEPQPQNTPPPKKESAVFQRVVKQFFSKL